MTNTDRDLAGKQVVITGANTGIGRSTAEQLAASGSVHVIVEGASERVRKAVHRSIPLV